MNYTLAGWKAVDPNAPVTHLSYFEADAFACWKGFRLPTEFEWEAYAKTQNLKGGRFLRDPIENDKHKINHIIGERWQWTSSSYAPYPGFKKESGALGEYNGKFMCNQYVLRGGSIATPEDHFRLSYRNFFPCHSRWQFTGIRLAKSI